MLEEDIVSEHHNNGSFALSESEKTSEISNSKSGTNSVVSNANSLDDLLSQIKHL